MKSFLHTCPLVILTILISFMIACSMGMQRISAFPVSSEGAEASDTQVPPSVGVSSSPVFSRTPSTAPASSASPLPSVASSPASGSSARKQSSKPASQRSEPQAGQPLFHAVKQDYFGDALFVGDSLTEDLKKYGGLNNASYFYHVGLSIYQLFEHPKPDAVSGRTFEQTLRGRRYKKIYIMLGINEMGTGNTAYFVRHYSAALSKIRTLQPNAVLYIESILPVTAEKSETDSVFNNPRIRERDESLRQLANGKNIFYLDVASALKDRFGNLPAEYSGDDIHLKAKYYPLWTNFLLNNAVLYEDAAFS